MKKLALSLVVGAALAFTPLSSFALTAMSADTMKDATGQAGVSIAVDEIVLYQTIGETMYIDIDGDEGYLNTDSAAVTISGKATYTTIRALLDDTDRAGFLKTAFSDGTNTGYYTIMHGGVDGVGSRASQTEVTPGNFVDATDAAGDAIEDIEIAALSIDVSSAASISTKLKGSEVAAVVIGLPTIEICKTGDTQTIGIWACDANGTKTANGGALIEITKEDSVLTVLGGTLEIAAH